MAKKAPTAPTGLSPSGRRLWREIAGRYELRADEREILHQAARTADLVAELSVQVERDGVMVEGSRGQPRVHPALIELQKGRHLLASLLAKLDLPEDEESFATQRARNAAESRWALHRRKEALRNGTA